MKGAFFFTLLFLIAVSSRGQEILSTEIIPELVIQGNGNTDMLLIPCMSCRWNAWEEFMARNESKYKMYAVTLPGYGGTPLPQLPLNSDGTPWRDNALEGLSKLLDNYEMKDVVVVGHSWGSMVAIQLAAQRKDVIARVISVDGTVESTSWTPDSRVARETQAKDVIADWQPKLENAEEWSQFNGAGVGNTFGKTDSVTTETMLTRIKLVSSFMATHRDAVLQYWRENPLIDLTASLHQIEVPILDIQSFTGEHQYEQRAQYLESLKIAKSPSNVQPVFMYDTKHFIMYHRPLELDCMIESFVMGKPVGNFAPTTSEYFVDEMAN